MKIYWLNADMTEAIVERGWLWWKRRAHVRRISQTEWGRQSSSRWWRFVPSDRIVDSDVCGHLETSKERIIEERKGHDWQPVRALPEAQVVKR